jgi:hypothetical protein
MTVVDGAKGAAAGALIAQYKKSSISTGEALTKVGTTGRFTHRVQTKTINGPSRFHDLRSELLLFP